MATSKPVDVERDRGRLSVGRAGLVDDKSCPSWPVSMAIISVVCSSLRGGKKGNFARIARSLGKNDGGLVMHRGHRRRANESGGRDSGWSSPSGRHLE